MSTRTCLSMIKSCCESWIKNKVKNSQVTSTHVLVCYIHPLRLTTLLCNERDYHWIWTELLVFLTFNMVTSFSTPLRITISSRLNIFSPPTFFSVCDKCTFFKKEKLVKKDLLNDSETHKNFYLHRCVIEYYAISMEISVLETGKYRKLVLNGVCHRPYRGRPGLVKEYMF